MASRTVVSLHPVFQELFQNLFTHEVRRVERLLDSCCHEETYGSGDNISGWSCKNRALVSDLNTGLAFCERHWEATRG